MQLIFPLVPLFLNHRKTAIFTSFIPTQLLAFLRVYPILFVLCNLRIISHFLLSFLICLPTTRKHMNNTQSLSMMPSLICPVIKIIFTSFYYYVALCWKLEEFFHGKGFPQIPKGLKRSKYSFMASKRALLWRWSIFFKNYTLLFSFSSSFS